MPADAATGTPVHTGDDVLDWLRSAEGRAVAARFVNRRGLLGGAILVDDVLAESALQVLQRLCSANPLSVESPGGYGTAVIRSVVRRIVRGRDVPLDESAEPEDLAPDLEPVTAGDGVRVLFEALPPAEPWLASASLAYLVYLMHPAAMPEDVPAPRAGSTVDQARCWPALWLAGERDVFPSDGADPHRRTRARRIAKVRARVHTAFARLRAGLVPSDTGADDGR